VTWDAGVAGTQESPYSGMEEYFPSLHHVITVRQVISLCYSHGMTQKVLELVITQNQLDLETFHFVTIFTAIL
jgi:hypothetical protein